MAITHATVKAHGDRGTHDEWNADHVVAEPQQPRLATTLVVAASDSDNTEQADYLCDGTADEVQINLAISALPATGGKVILLEGTFKLAATVAFDKGSVIVQGMGCGTIIEQTGEARGFSIVSFDNIVIRDMHLYASVIPAGIWAGVFIQDSLHITVENVKFTGHWSNGIYAFDSSNYPRFLNCFFDTLDDLGIQIIEADFALIEGNVILSCPEAGIVCNVSDWIIVSKNRVSNCGTVGLMGNISTTGDYGIIESNSLEGGVNQDIWIQVAADRTLVHGNMIFGGTLTDNSATSTLADNVL